MRSGEKGDKHQARAHCDVPLVTPPLAPLDLDDELGIIGVRFGDVEACRDGT